MNPDNYGTNINGQIRDRDVDEVNLANMSEEELDIYIDENYGYIDHPEVK